MHHPPTWLTPNFEKKGRSSDVKVLDCELLVVRLNKNEAAERIDFGNAL
jgi:hypothetical protein